MHVIHHSRRRSLLLPASSLLMTMTMVFAGLLLCAPLASADILTLMVNATNAPDGALDRAQQDAAVFLQKLTAMEGPAYTAIAPGQALPYSVRMLRGGGGEGGEDEDLEEEEAEAGANGNRRRKLIDCPNQCSNSGSYTCRLLGCAYCGACRRLLITDEAGRELWQNKQRKIERMFTTQMTAAYCDNVSGCVLQASIQRVNTDGTLAPAV
jgi:hypothetical protein